MAINFTIVLFQSYKAKCFYQNLPANLRLEEKLKLQ
ncbi:unnamed protein product [Arabidopsis halleri]